MDKEFHDLIWSEDEVRKFVRILSPLKQEEAYFLSVSARNKQLTEEERRYYSLGRTEMFFRRLVKNTKTDIPLEDTYLRVLKSMCVKRGGYTSRGGIPLPDKCLMVYANLNPSSGLKALKMFENQIMDALFDFRTDPEKESAFGHLDTLLMNCYQKCRGTKTIIDIDFDIPEEGFSIVENFLYSLQEHNVIYYVIKTKGGYHVLLKNDSIGFNFHEGVQKANAVAQKQFGTDHVEVMINGNGMCVVPGTYQAGHKVKFLEI